MPSEHRAGLRVVGSGLADLLVEPFVSLGSVERRNARMLASLLLCVVGLGLLSAVVQAIVVPGFRTTFISITAALAVLGVAYAGSRTRLYRVSAAFAAIAPALACIAVGVQSADDRVWHGFILIAVIVAVLFFSVRTAALVALAIFITICMLPLWAAHLQAPARIVPILALHGVVSPLLLVAAHHHAAVAEDNHKELRRMDARLLELDRLESATRAAGRVAHDFNNLIAIIDANAVALDSTIPGGRREEIAEIRMAVERAAALSRGLLTSSRPENSRVRALDAGKFLRAFEPLLTRIAGTKVELIVRANGPFPPIAMNPLELEQVLMNLIVNARDAMPEGGRVTVTCEDARFDEAYATQNPGAHAGRHVVIAVTDSGTGMTPTVLERAFEPFFTTKDAGRGTGLGLAIVRETVARNGGHVTVTSTLGIGSSFRVCFSASISTT